MYTNTDCLPNKIEELEMFLHSEKIDIAAINETNPKKSPPGEVLNFDIIPGYKCVYNSSGRGVCLYIKNSIQFTRCLEIESLFSPSVFCKLSLSKKKSVLVGSIYRSPSSKDSDCNDLMKQLNHVYSLSKSTGDKFILLGDFNLPDINWNDESCVKNIEHISSKFLEFVKVNDITQFITSPTHHRTTQTPTLIDLILSNDSHLVSEVAHFPPFGLSHHSVLSFSTNFSPHTVEATPVLKYQIDKGDYTGMRSYMSKTKDEWDIELEGTNVDSCWEVIDSQVKTAKDMFIPKKNVQK